MGAAQKQVSPVVVVVAVVVLLVVIGLIFKFTLFPSQNVEFAEEDMIETLDDGSVLVTPKGFPRGAQIVPGGGP